MTMTKQCNRCKEIKNKEEGFYKSKTVKDGYRNQCITCVLELKRCRNGAGNKKFTSSDTLPTKPKLNANLENGVVQARVGEGYLSVQEAESFAIDEFKEWIMDNNPDFDKVIMDQVYLPQEKKVLAKRLHKLAEQLER